MSEIYFSVDVESDGPIPGPNSMYSFGVAAFDERGELLDKFTRNLEELEGASGEPDTVAWWLTQPSALAACRSDRVPPALAMKEFVHWVEHTCREHDSLPVCMASPAGYDWTFLYWYIMRFVRRSPFSHSCLDMKSYAMAVLKKPFRACRKKNYPRSWFGPTKHSHVALEDAIEQGEMFFRMRDQNLRGRI